MGYFITFILTTIPGGISILLLLWKKKKIDEVLLKLNNNYVNNNNMVNVIKIIKAYKNRSKLEQKEKRLIVQSLIFFIVGYTTIIVWGVVLLFFPDFIFSLNNS